MKFEPLLKAAPFSGARVKPFDGTRQYLSTGDLQDDSLSFVEVTFKDKPSRADIAVREGDVLFARMKGTKKVLRVTQELADTIVSTGFAVLRPGEDCDPAYLATYLSTDYFERQKAKYCSGAIQPAITNGGIEKLQIPLPPVNDQIRIAHLLGKVEGLIAQRKQHLQQLDELLKSVFLDMFGDPVRNQRVWPTEPLGALATIERGRFSPRPRNDPKYYGGNYPFIQTGDISRSKGRLRDYTQTLNELGTKVSKEFSVDTIVIAIVGATIGETAVLEIPTYAPDSVIGISPHSADRRDSVFIEYVLRFWKPVLRARAPDAARANINIETLRPLQIIVPPERHKFSDLMQKIEVLEMALKSSLADLEALYGALSQQAFKGELDVSRVPLPRQTDETPDLTKQTTMEPTTPASFQLPDPELTDWLTVENRSKLIEFWLIAWCERYAEEPFAASRFLDAAYQRLVELSERDAFQFDKPGKGFDEGKWYEEPAPFVINEYEQIKKWIFEALASGKLTQGFDDADNLIQLKAAQA